MHSPEMADLWSDQARYEAWTEVEVLAAEAQVRPGRVPEGADHVVFGTDYPLPAQDDPAGGALRDLRPQNAELAGGTAARLLGW
jgi:hypothetical protein